LQVHASAFAPELPDGQEVQEAAEQQLLVCEIEPEKSSAEKIEGQAFKATDAYEAWKILAP